MSQLPPPHEPWRTPQYQQQPPQQGGRLGLGFGLGTLAGILLPVVAVIVVAATGSLDAGLSEVVGLVFVALPLVLFLAGALLMIPDNLRALGVALMTAAGVSIITTAGLCVLLVVGLLAALSGSH